MNPFRTLPLVAVVAAIVVGCSSPGSSPSASPIAVDGHTYLSTDVVGQLLVPGSRITLSFKDRNLSASAGCNTMSGAYTIADGRLKVGQMASTMMGCDPLLMRQDTWLSTYLSDVGIAQDGDTLHLDDGTVQVTLVDREVADPDKPLEGTKWIVTGLVGNQAVSTVGGVVAWLRIVDGQAEVDTGCNTGGGDVEVADTTLTFGPMALTKKACEGGAATTEAAMLAVLDGAVDYAIDASELTLDHGENGLILHAAPGS
jgi:heat shock protein HslJ